MEFRVKDTGIGFTEQEKDIIFDSFVQANKNISVEFGGLGLGLSIVKEYCQLLNGKLEAYSKPGEETVFKFILPKEESA